MKKEKIIALSLIIGLCSLAVSAKTEVKPDTEAKNVQNLFENAKNTDSINPALWKEIREKARKATGAQLADDIKKLTQAPVGLYLNSAPSFPVPTLSKVVKKASSAKKAKNPATKMLMEATVNGNIKKARLAILAGADVNTTEYAYPPLLSAMANDNTQVAEFLIGFGADVNGRGVGGVTPLMAAADKGDLHSTWFLCAKKADINAKDSISRTPLMYAVKKGHSSIVFELLKRGADVNVKSDMGQTALSIAESRGFTSIVEMLKAAGANAGVTTEALKRFKDANREKILAVDGVMAVGIAGPADSSILIVFHDGSRSAEELNKDLLKQVPEIANYPVKYERMDRLMPRSGK
ncbi:ankyrin repeat domain-containing protein [Elusimicrobiota bacterium]